MEAPGRSLRQEQLTLCAAVGFWFIGGAAVLGTSPREPADSKKLFPRRYRNPDQARFLVSARDKRSPHLRNSDMCRGRQDRTRGARRPLRCAPTPSRSRPPATPAGRLLGRRGSGRGSPRRRGTRCERSRRSGRCAAGAPPRGSPPRESPGRAHRLCRPRRSFR